MNIAESMNSDSPGFITGKPLVLGGSHGRDSATAKGVTIVIHEAAKKRGINVKGARVVVQGFGNAGKKLYLLNLCMTQVRRS